MTDLDPAIWDNPTLGAAAQNENLDRLTKQQIEDRSAKLEGRERREVVVDNTYPDWSPDVSERTGTVPSNYQTVHFADEQQNDIPTDSAPVDETASGLDVETSEGETSEVSEESEPTTDSVESPASDSSEESDSTQWT